MASPGEAAFLPFFPAFCFLTGAFFFWAISAVLHDLTGQALAGEDPADEALALLLVDDGDLNAEAAGGLADDLAVAFELARLALAVEVQRERAHLVHAKALAAGDHEAAARDVDSRGLGGPPGRPDRLVAHGDHRIDADELAPLDQLDLARVINADRTGLLGAVGNAVDPAHAAACDVLDRDRAIGKLAGHVALTAQELEGRRIGVHLVGARGDGRPVGGDHPDLLALLRQSLHEINSPASWSGSAGAMPAGTPVPSDT